MKWILLISVLICFIYGSSCETPPRQGEMIYNRYCANCHMEEGQGLRSLIPPLHKADYLEKHYTSLACIIVNGISGPIEVNGVSYDQPMPGSSRLNATEVGNLINYLSDEMMVSPRPYVGPEQVMKWLETCD